MTWDILYGLGLILLFSLWIGVGIMGAVRAKRGPCDCRECEPVKPEAHGCFEEPSEYAQKVAERREKEAKRIQKRLREFETNLARASKREWN